MNRKICFFSPGAYSYLSKSIEKAGGSELFQVILAKELIKKDFDISFIVDDYGQKNIEYQDGIKIFKLAISRYKNVTKFPSRIYNFWKVLGRINADIYYQRGATAETGIIAFFCSMKKKKFVYGMSSDIEVNGAFENNSKIYERILYNYGIKRAFRIVQSEYQKKSLKIKSNLNSIVIKNPCPPVKDINDNDSNDIKVDPPIVLWVGTIKPEWKCPMLFLKLANAIPNAKFQMVGGSGIDSKYYEYVKRCTAQIPNLEFRGFISYPDINKVFSKSSILVNTSNVEGFSNTFLQAWAESTPVVSLNSDPDEIICKYKLGFHSRTFGQMIIDVDTLLKDKSLRMEMGNNGKRFIEKEHNLKNIVDKYENIFN